MTPEVSKPSKGGNMKKSLVISILAILAAGQVDAKTCQLVSEGLYSGTWVKHRILVDGEAIAGADQIGQLLGHLERLRTEGVCP